MESKLKIIGGYLLSLILVIALEIYISINYPFKSFYFVAILMIIISLVGDYFIYAIVKELINKQRDEIIINENNKNQKDNEMFFKFCEIQQTNIRHYYHDISNHLITLKILKEENKKEEYDKYLEYIKEEYNKIILKDKSDNALIDILIEYFLKEGINVSIKNSDNKKIDYVYLLEILNILKHKNKNIDVDLDNKVIYVENINIDKEKYKEYSFEVKNG